MTKSNIIDLDLHLHHETEKAVLVSEDGNKDNAVWLPLSQIEIESESGYVVVTLPEWLSLEKGLT